MIENPQTLGIRYQLGCHRATYKPDTIGAIIGPGTFLLLFLYIIIAVITLFLRGSLQSLVLICGLVSFSGLLAIGFLFLLIHAYQRRVLRVFVYEHGLIRVGDESPQGLNRTKRHIIFWKEVQTVRHYVYTSTDLDTTGTHHVYVVECIDGISLALNDTFADLHQLGKLIEELTVRYLFPVTFHAYQTNGAVPFGPLVVTSRGISYGQSTLPWSKIKRIAIGESAGYIVIRKQGNWLEENWLEWASVKLGEVPNVEVFKEMVHLATKRPFQRNFWTPSPLIQESHL